MATSNLPTNLSKAAQQGIIEFHKQAYNILNQQWNIREQMRQVDLAYLREQDLTAENQAAKISNRYGDPTKYQNITVPVVKPSVETAVS